MFKDAIAGGAKYYAATPTHGRTQDMAEDSTHLAVSACVINLNDPIAHCANTIVMRNGALN